MYGIDRGVRDDRRRLDALVPDAHGVVGGVGERREDLVLHEFVQQRTALRLRVVVDAVGVGQESQGVR